MAKMIRNIPNCITATRLLATAFILLVEPFSKLFFIIVVYCGLSDIVDGYVARKFSLTSKLGQMLDSIADFVFIGIMLLIYMPVLQLPFWELCWIATIFMIRIASLAIGFVRFRQLPFLHTYTNKATGMALFCSLLLHPIFGEAVTAIVVCTVGSISAIEDLFINALSKTLARDVKTIFHLN